MQNGQGLIFIYPNNLRFEIKELNENEEKKIVHNLNDGVS
jgi:hypothetical protein